MSVENKEVPAVKKPETEAVEVTRNINLLPFKNSETKQEGFVVSQIFDLARNGLLPGQTKEATEEEAVRLATIVTTEENKHEAADLIVATLEQIYHNLMMKGLPLPASRSADEMARTWVAEAKKADKKADEAAKNEVKPDADKKAEAKITFGTAIAKTLNMKGHYPQSAIQKWVPRVGKVLLETLLVAASVLTAMALIGPSLLLIPVATVAFYFAHRADKSGGVTGMLAGISEEVSRNLSGKYKNAGSLSKMQIAKSALFGLIAVAAVSVEGLGIYGGVKSLVSSFPVLARAATAISAVAAVIGTSLSLFILGFIYSGYRDENRVGLRNNKMSPAEKGSSLDEFVSNGVVVVTEKAAEATYTDRSQDLAEDVLSSTRGREVLYTRTNHLYLDLVPPVRELEVGLEEGSTKPAKRFA